MTESPAFIEIASIFSFKADKAIDLLERGEYKLVWTKSSVEGRTVMKLYLQRKKGKLEGVPVDIEDVADIE